MSGKNLTLLRFIVIYRAKTPYYVHDAPLIRNVGAQPKERINTTSGRELHFQLTESQADQARENLDKLYDPTIRTLTNLWT